jgi:AcrR family transcriptional regulator
VYKKFEALSEDKRLRIINSCFDEFAHKQFKEASTDDIAARAGISKGALFQYFGTKRQLYFYIYNYAYEMLLKEFWGEADLTNPDLLDRMRGIFHVKMNLFRKHPNLFNFMLYSFTRETDKEIKAFTTKEYNTQKPDVFTKLLAGIDYTKFKEGFDSKHVVSIITWVIDGYANAEVAKLKNEDLDEEKYNFWIRDLDEYIKTLKKAFYKEE